MLKKKKEKTGYHHGNLREAILEASLDWIKKNGVDSLSLREIAKKLGVTHSAPNKHFPKKEVLLATLIEQGFIEFKSYLESSGVEMETKPKEAFIRMGLGYIRFANKNPEIYRLMFSHTIVNFMEYPGMLKAGQEAFDVLHNSVRLLQSKNVVRQGNSLEIAYMIWSFTHGFVLLSQDGKLKGVQTEMDTQSKSEEDLMKSLFLMIGEGITK